MRIGLHALGIGAGAERPVIDAVARTAEQQGFSTLWAGEHVVMVDRSSSRYPYAPDGQIAVPAAADWLDALICLSFAAAATSTITIATRGAVVAGAQSRRDREDGCDAGRPVRRPIGPRRRRGVVVGGVRGPGSALRPARRAYRGVRRRHADHLAPGRRLLRGRVRPVRRHPGEPEAVGRRAIPIVVGGNSDTALRRVARWGDGWYGFNVDGLAEVAERVRYLQTCCDEAGRDMADLHLAVALRDP
jgi:alkanesulfonate monooxygenase SsuD/methylene tetrahydromethanopterin reductase-like flavin-dependent oxidoreductase (luciferase family)